MKKLKKDKDKDKDMTKTKSMQASTKMVKGIRNLHPNGIFALQHIQLISSALDWKNMKLFSWL